MEWMYEKQKGKFLEKEKLLERNVWCLRREKLERDVCGSHSSVAEDTGL
jgi:hypothetical protein